jgi:uncharacterized Tic20 family protein
MNLTEELERLQQLHQSGGLSDEEYAKAKAALLDGQPPAAAPVPPKDTSAFVEQQTRQWAMLLHFSLLAGFVLPFAGLVVPILIWQLKKTDLPGIDVHGKIVVNWIISLVIYGAVCALLIFVLIGIPLLVALGIVAVILPIIGGIKANNGEVWNYPLAISFLQ